MLQRILLAGLVGLRFAGFAISGGPILGILFFGATIGTIMSMDTSTNKS